MKNQRRRLLALALVLCMLLPLFATVNAAETEPVADTPAAEASETAVPATEMPASTSLEPIEAEQQVSLSDDGIRIIKGESKSLIPEPEVNRGDAALGTAGSANPLTAAGVVWTSSDPTVATVDSTGTVTAHELGEATISATLNGEVIETFTVYSIYADDFYAISAYSSAHYICPDNISMANNVRMHAMPESVLSEESMAFRDELGYKWYLEHQGNNYYTIHPAYSLGMVLYLHGGVVPILRQEAGLTSNAHHWKIVSTGGGSVLQNKTFTDTSIKFEEANTDGAAIVSTDYSTSDNSQKWSFNYAQEPSGLLLFDTDTGALVDDTWVDTSTDHTAYTITNDPVYLTDIGLYLQVLDPSSTSTSFEMSMVPALATFNTASLRLTGHTYISGPAVITKTIYGTQYEVEFTLSVCRSIETITVLYDNAYTVRYSNYQSLLDTHLEKLTEVFLEEMQRCLLIEQREQFTSYGDLCLDLYENPYQPSQACPHYAQDGCKNSGINPSNNTLILEEIHHKNAYNIFYRTSFPAGSKCLSYIGHNICYNSGSAHHINGMGNGTDLYGLANKAHGLAQIYDHESDAHATATTVHEVGHLFGAPDHYDGAPNGWTLKELNDLTSDKPFKDICIYGNSKEDASVINNITICEGCQRVIRGELDLT